MENGSFEMQGLTGFARSFLARAQTTKVLGRFWSHVVEQLK